eukprot:gene4135-5175_t
MKNSIKYLLVTLFLLVVLAQAQDFYQKCDCHDRCAQPGYTCLHIVEDNVKLCVLRCETHDDCQKNGMDQACTNHRPPYGKYCGPCNELSQVKKTYKRLNDNLQNEKNRIELLPSKSSSLSTNNRNRSNSDSNNTSEEYRNRVDSKNKLHKENSDMIKLAIREVRQNQDSAINSLNALKEQTEQLKSMDKKVDNIDNHLNSTRKTVDEMNRRFF